MSGNIIKLMPQLHTKILNTVGTILIEKWGPEKELCIVIYVRQENFMSC